MNYVFRNTGGETLFVEGTQAGAPIRLKVPAFGTLRTTLTSISASTRALVQAGDLIVTPSITTNAIPVALPVAEDQKVLTRGEAVRLFSTLLENFGRNYVTRSEFQAAGASGAVGAIHNKTTLSAYKGLSESVALSAQPTSAPPLLNAIFITLISRLEFWQIQPWDGESEEDIDAGVIRPNDFNSVTNPRVLVRLFAI